jgi:acetyl esterase
MRSRQAAGVGGITVNVRHTAVRLVWKIVDAMSDIVAAKALLPAGVAVSTDISYADRDGLLLDVYRSEGRQEQLPLILYIHGGGLVAGDKRHYRQYCMTLAAAGYTVMNINYRLAPADRYPAQLQDVFAAMRWATTHAHTYGGDAGRMVLMGDSAGAYLAAMAACICSGGCPAGKGQMQPPVPPEALAGVAVYCGFFAMHTAAGRKFPGIRSNLEMALGRRDLDTNPGVRELSVPDNLTDRYPPVFIASGAVDGLHPESQAFAVALTENSVPCETLFFDKRERNAFHGFQARLQLPTARQCLREVTDFLEAVTARGGQRL